MSRCVILVVAVFATGCAPAVHPQTTYAQEIGGTTGSPICDEYFWKYKTCIVHEDHQEPLRSQDQAEYDRRRAIWTDIPSRDPETQASIIAACRENLERDAQHNECPGVY